MVMRNEIYMPPRVGVVEGTKQEHGFRSDAIGRSVVRRKFRPVPNDLHDLTGIGPRQRTDGRVLVDRRISAHSLVERIHDQRQELGRKKLNVATEYDELMPARPIVG